MPDTQRMTLRRTSWPDVDEVAALYAAVAVTDPTDHDSPSPAAQVLANEMPRLMAHNARRDQLGSWVARDRSTGRFLGWFTVAPVDSPERTVRLSYQLLRRASGNGYAVEGTLCMIAIARDARAGTVIATAAGDDVSFANVMEHAGLRRRPRPDETTGRSTGTDHRDVDYVLELPGDAASAAIHQMPPARIG